MEPESSMSHSEKLSNNNIQRLIHPGHDGLHKQWLHEHHNYWWRVLGVREDPETKSFRHFPYNENPTRAQNTSSLKCCLPSTDTVLRREKVHACVWRFQIASFSQDMFKIHVSMLMEGILNISCEKDFYVVCWYVLIFLYFPSINVLWRVGENRF